MKNHSAELIKSRRDAFRRPPIYSHSAVCLSLVSATSGMSWNLLESVFPLIFQVSHVSAGLGVRSPRGEDRPGEVTAEKAGVAEVQSRVAWLIIKHVRSNLLQLWDTLFYLTGRH